MITFNTPGISTGLRVRSELNGWHGTITEYNHDYVEANMMPSCAKKGFMAVTWDNGTITSNVLYDPSIGRNHVTSSPFNSVEIISNKT